MNVKLENKKTQVPHIMTQHQLNQILDIRNSESTPFTSVLSVVRSSQNKRRYARQKRAKHCGADHDALPSAHRAVLLSRTRRVSRGQAWAAGRNGLVQRGEVDGRGSVSGCEAGVEARCDEHGPAARADCRRVWRREGHVVIWVERARDGAG